MPYPGFYSEVIRECDVSGLSESCDNFLMFGVIYLTEQATEQFFETEPESRRQKFIHHLLHDDKSVVEKFSTGTSVTVWCRHYYLASGGNDEDFNGWGYEDLEFACRAIRRRKKFALPAEFALDYRNFQSITEYKGWKSIYRLFGDMTFQKGMVMFHAWHPVHEASNYMAAKAKNRKLFERKIAAFRDHGVEPDSLSLFNSGKSLVLRDNPWVTNRWARPFLGEIVHIDEDHLDPENILGFLAEYEFDRVVFHNPYANERIQALYSCVKRANFPFIVVERGALPDSVFFDENGFNADSESYHEKRWNRPLTHERRVATLEYIKNTLSNDESLEAQPDRLGLGAIRKRLRISTGKKILVAFLQRPTDTVIKNFMGPLGTYDEFLRLLARLPYTMPPDWVLLVKQHPLEAEKIAIPGAIDADDFNTKDLVELSNATIFVNSGVGLLGIMAGKTVLHCGDAFYGHEGVAKRVITHEEVNAALMSFVPDREKALRFVSYLVNEFYSFGRFSTRKVRWHDGSWMTATTAIDFYTLRVPGHAEVRRQLRDSVEVASSSILFDRYRTNSGDLNLGTTTANKAVVGDNKASASKAISQTKLPGVASGASKAPLWKKRLKKLKNNPVMYLRDSKIGLFRAIGNRMSVQ